MPQTATRTSTSSARIEGTGTASTRMSFAPWYTAAFIVAGVVRVGMGREGYPICRRACRRGPAAAR